MSDSAHPTDGLDTLRFHASSAYCFWRCKTKPKKDSEQYFCHILCTEDSNMSAVCAFLKAAADIKTQETYFILYLLFTNKVT